MSSQTSTPTLQDCKSCGGGAPVDVHFCPQCTKILSLGRHGDYFSFLGLPRKLNIDPSELERRFRDAQPAVSSRLLLQRGSGRAPCQPGAELVPERRVPGAQAARHPRRVPAAAGRPGGARAPGGVQAGAGGPARGSVRPERGARRSARAPRERRAGRRVARAARSRARSRSKPSASSTRRTSRRCRRAGTRCSIATRRRPSAARC